ncbi:hypothetical protein CRV24_004897 [Beauveria bassiana]|nr:hypothetical protein CRV24_004897 [Beauveria bassiana]
MPKELEELFESILTSKADEPAESLLLMQWICFAQDVMTVRQLRWAIVIDVERSGVDDPEKSLDDYFDDDAYIGDDEDMERRIVVLSCGLAEVVAGRVQFIHQAVKEFFLGQGFALLRSQADLQDRGTAVATAEHKSGHYRLARTCIRYLYTLQMTWQALYFTFQMAWQTLLFTLQMTWKALEFAEIAFATTQQPEFVLQTAIGFRGAHWKMGF